MLSWSHNLAIYYKNYVCFQDSLHRITVPANHGQEEPEPMENVVLACDVTDMNHQ
jgi:hypothetical protein